MGSRSQLFGLLQHLIKYAKKYSYEYRNIELQSNCSNFIFTIRVGGCKETLVYGLGHAIIWVGQVVARAICASIKVS